AFIGLVVAGLTAAAAAVASVLRTVRAHVTITRLPADAPLPSPSVEPAEPAKAGTHTFTFSHSGVIGKPTPEQKEVLERLQRGELTPQQAAEALGGTSHTFGTRIELGAGAHHERDDALEEALEPVEGPPLPPLRWVFGALALLIVIGGLMWLGGGPTTRDH